VDETSVVDSEEYEVVGVVKLNSESQLTKTTQIDKKNKKINILFIFSSKKYIFEIIFTFINKL